MNTLEFIVLVLATWRISNLVVDDSEDGPWDVLHKVRHLMGIRYDDKNRAYGINEIGRAATCMWCFSLWVGLFVFLVGYYVSSVPFYPFALSAGALMTNKMIKR
jgi:hypothetical protein